MRVEEASLLTKVGDYGQMEWMEWRKNNHLRHFTFLWSYGGWIYGRQYTRISFFWLNTMLSSCWQYTRAFCCWQQHFEEVVQKSLAFSLAYSIVLYTCIELCSSWCTTTELIVAVSSVFFYLKLRNCMKVHPLFFSCITQSFLSAVLHTLVQSEASILSANQSTPWSHLDQSQRVR